VATDSTLKTPACARSTAAYARAACRFIAELANLPPEIKQRVEMMAQQGVPQEQIAALLKQEVAKMKGANGGGAPQQAAGGPPPGQPLQ